MSGEIVNLRKARKAHARAEDKARAAANRAAHGRPKAETAALAAERARQLRVLDGHRREPDEET